MRAQNRSMDPVAFLRLHEPFRSLSPAAVRRLEETLEVDYAPQGRRILERGGAPSRHLWVVRKGAVRLEIESSVIDVLGAGECFAFPSLLARSAPRFDAIADEGSLLYRLPAEVFQEFLRETAFEEYFRSGLADRLRKATTRESTPLAGDLATPLGELVARPPVFIHCHATVGEAARLMRDERISSVLIQCEPPGILTDRDLRSRVLAEGLGPETLVSEVMSTPLRTFPAAAPIWEALVHLLDQRSHHLAVERDGEVVGMVTHTDLLRHHGRSPSQLLKRIEKAGSAADLHGYASEVAATVEFLLSGGLEPLAVGQVVASLNDAVVTTLLRLVERELGGAPCPYAWIVFGSEGRREQTLLTDQDNALVYDEATAQNASWFARLAEEVVGAQIEVGFPPCAGGFMATNWCHPLGEWEAKFRSWTSEPDPQALLDVANLFDFRELHGGLSLEPLHVAVEEGAAMSTFLAHLTRASLRMRPPIGLFHRIRAEDGELDLKAAGIIPVVGIARVLALASGSRERGTVARLGAARRAGSLSEEDASDLEAGYRFLFRLRLNMQLSQQRQGENPTNRIRLDDLGAVDARHLKETLLHIRDVQTGLSRRFQVDMLG